MVSEQFILWDDPRLGIVGGLLVVWFVKSPIVVASVLKEGWIVTTYFESHIVKIWFGLACGFITPS